MSETTILYCGAGIQMWSPGQFSTIEAAKSYAQSQENNPLTWIEGEPNTYSYHRIFHTPGHEWTIGYFQKAEAK